MSSHPAPRGRGRTRALTLLSHHRPPDVASSHSPRQLSTSAIPVGQGACDPFPLWAYSSSPTPHWPECVYMVPPAAREAGNAMRTSGKAIQGKKGKRTLGDSLQSAIPGQGVAFPENDPRNAKRKRGPTTHTFHGPKSEQCCILCFILSCPCVCGG